MFPTHADSICTVNTLDYQERLREAARERLAASAQEGPTFPLARASKAFRIGTVWLDSILTRRSGRKKALVASATASS